MHSGWEQETNFVEKFVNTAALNRKGVDGYKPIHVWSTKNGFGGLEANLPGPLYEICDSLSCGNRMTVMTALCALALDPLPMDLLSVTQTIGGMPSVQGKPTTKGLPGPQGFTLIDIILQF